MAMLRMKEEGLLDCKLRLFSHILTASLFAVLAQIPVISDLATTDDGYLVYFRINDSPEIGGVYRLSENRLEPFLSDPPRDLLFYIFDRRYLSPAVSANGQTVIGQYTFRCGGGSSCIPYPNYTSADVFRADGRRTGFGGFGSLSANGRFLFHAGRRVSIGINEQYRHLADLENGDDIDTGLATQTFRYAVTDDGRVINRATPDSKGVVIWSRQGGARRLAFPFNPEIVDAAINSIGTHVAYQAEPRGIGLLHLASNSIYPISDSGARVSFASVAGRVVFIENGRAFDYEIASGRRRQLYDGEVTDVIESANGNVAYVVNARLQIVRIDLPSLENRIVFTRLRGLFTSTATEAIVPGSLHVLRGPLPVQSAQSSFPLPAELNGLRVSIDGQPAPIVSVDPAGVVFQVPHSLPNDTTRLSVSIGKLLSTELNTAVRQRQARFLPATFPASNGQPLVFHEGFTGIVSGANPARSHETIHLYGVGFGAVDTAIPDGFPAPANPPARVTNPPFCTMSRFPDPAVDIALAPGFAGIYQINVTIPRNVSIFTSQLSCGGIAFASIPVAP
ncbi:MAG: hypothetical protein FJW38_05760 [Acidobacteria bacterium]|nr:hypothetical protein [Acidobacteriota bacterium]